MQWNLVQKFVFIFLFVLVLHSCQKELSCINCADNKPPLAIAGNDQVTQMPKDSILLDGSNSKDTDGSIVKWQWSKISGPDSSIISNETALKTIVKGLKEGIYVFQLKVTDNGGLNAYDSVQVIVDNPNVNQPPIANAGIDQTVNLPFSNIILDGSASIDPEKDITQYLWTKVAGPSFATIIVPENKITEVNNLIEGNYQFELKVTDGGGLYSKDTVIITVKPDSNLICDLSSRSVSNATLVEIGRLSEPRIPAVGAAGNKIVFAGGANGFDCGFEYHFSSAAIDIYDIITQSWKIFTLSQARNAITVASGANKILFAGGIQWKEFPGMGEWNEHYTNVDIYDASNDTWSIAHLSKPRINMSALTIGNKIIFAGGTFYSGNQIPQESNVIDIFDLTTNTWSTSTLSVARWGMSCIVIGSKAYFAGGRNLMGTVLNAVDIYNMHTNSWSTSHLPEDIALSNSYQIADFLFWAESNQVTLKNVISTIKTSNCVSGATFNYSGLKNDNLVFLTGKNPNQELIQFDIYNTLNGRWSIGKINQSFMGSANASVITTNNNIYLAGGVSGNNPCQLIFHDKVFALNW